VIRLQPGEYKALAQYVYSLCAITLDESKTYLLESRLAALVDETGAGSYSGLILRARSDPSRKLERRIIDAITTNETSFFRDTSPFDLLRHKIIPDLIDRRTRTGRSGIRIWSAACSTGQELYSIAILLKELLGDPDRYGVSLTGTDISDAAVAQASRGRFTKMEISRGLTDAQRTRYFLPADGGHWRICDELRAMACFKTFNLMSDFSPLGRFDVIFCRNVAIYFADRDRVSLFGRMERALDVDGCLIIGAMESLNGISARFEAKRHVRSVYYQPVAAPERAVTKPVPALSGRW
jgi:chemotaxis protein methyltransferase CheR